MFCQNTFEHGYNFEKETGNLLSREDRKYVLRETFTYDKLNRLEKIYQGNFITSTLVKTMTYATNGNITSQTGLGTYTYNSPRIHAVETVQNTTLFPSNPQKQSIAYNGFNKVETLSDGNHNYSFTYGPDEQRIKMDYFRPARSSNPLSVLSALQACLHLAVKWLQ